MVDDELWRTVIDRVEAGAIRPETVFGYWCEELRSLLDQAQDRAASHNSEEIIRDLRELQARCENVIAALAPAERGHLRLITAA